MDVLTTTENLRLDNLRILHGRAPGVGAPTSEFLHRYLKAKKVRITKTDLSQIYWGRKPITKELASQIEAAFDLPHGWMDEMHSYVFALTTTQNLVVKELLSLPDEVEMHLSSLVMSISRMR